MHPTSFALMDRLLLRLYPGDDRPLRVLDVGSLNINGTYRELVERRGWDYVGVDREQGANVDVVAHVGDISLDTWRHRMTAHGFSPRFDVVISGQTLEHDAAPWLTVRNVARVTNCASIVLIAPFVFPVHHEPDYWRFTGQGLAALLSYAGLQVTTSGIEGDRDAYAVGVRWWIQAPREQISEVT